jgi:hypothetical protein
MSLFSEADRAATVKAGRQEGALSHADAVGAGLSDEQIHHRCATGAWIRKVVGVYAVAGSPDSPLQRAWIAFLATMAAGGVLSFITAAAIHGLLPFSTIPHVTVPPHASARCRAAKVHRRVVPAIDCTWRGGLRVTSVSRTIVDLAGVVDRATLEQVVDVAFCRKVATRRSVLAALRRAGRCRGATVLRAVLDVWSERIEPGSVAEVRLLRSLGDLGLTGLVTQHEVFDADGGFVARLDVADPQRRRGLEYDGVEAHNPRRWDRDEPRYAALRALGWAIEPVTKLDLLPGEPRLRRIADVWLCARPSRVR